ncbi:MAG: hypothetical protein M3Z66_22180, partial [Chloroflexota bacterium]|nr:hypothetical protein [Chloroflexota bacterium]
GTIADICEPTRRHGMADQQSAVTPVPEHLHTVSPRLVVRDGARAIEFYRAAFTPRYASAIRWS